MQLPSYIVYQRECICLSLFKRVALILMAFGIGVPALAADRQFTFINSGSDTIWVAGTTNPGTQPVLPDNATGFQLDKGQQVTVTVSDHWNGRFWGRTGCTFDANGTGSCQTGDCGGKLHCQVTGALPASLAEFNLTGTPVDYYDVSLVDGYNLPMTITPSTLPSGTTYSNSQAGSCGLPGCTQDLNSSCPTELQVVANGVVVGCKSACTRFGDPKYCCTGAYGTAATCPPTEYSKIFKQACPTSYSYAYDDQTSTFGCAEGTNYTITFGSSVGTNTNTGIKTPVALYTGSSSSSGSSSGSSQGTNNNLTTSITNAASGKCMAVTSNGLAQAPCTKWTGQWVTTVQGQQSVCGTSDGHDIDAGPIWNNQDAQEKCVVAMSKYQGEHKQLWKLVAATSGTNTFSIQNTATQQCLQASSSSVVQLATCDNSSSQTFTFTKLSSSQLGGAYRVTLASDNTQCLTSGASTVSDTSAGFQIASCDNVPEKQQFILDQQFMFSSSGS